MAVLTPSLQVIRSTTLRRIRELPVPGDITVKIGDKVKANDTIGQAQLAGELIILRAPEKMGIEPFEVINGLKVTQGEAVKRDQVLCEHSGLFGLFRTIFRSPTDGIVELIAERTGHIAVRLASTPIECDAYISGTVVAVKDKSSATIESKASFIQGIFGVGGERYGPLNVLAVTPDTILTPEHLPVDVKGQIIVGGMAPTIETLRRASEGGAVGLIVGSIDDRALEGYLGYDLGIALTGDEEVSMTIIITEGFGRLAIAKRTLDLLSSLNGRTASINGATQVRAGALRPEIIVAEDRTLVRGAAGQPEEEPASLEVGRQVRLIRVPYFGETATVIELPHSAQTISTGAVARVLRARLQDGREVVVPRANVELIGTSSS